MMKVVRPPKSKQIFISAHEKIGLAAVGQIQKGLVPGVAAHARTRMYALDHSQYRT